MKNKKILIFLLLFICVGIICFTGAYFINNIQLDNEFNTSEFALTFHESFESPNDWEPGDVTEKIVYASNNSDTDVAVRIYFDDQWISADGSPLTNTQDGKSIAIVNLAHTSDWIKIGDYYYYKYRLKKNERTSDFMKSVTFNDEVDFSVNCEFLNSYYAGNCSYTTGDYYGATYNLNIVIETIQFDIYKDIWGSNINLLDDKPLVGSEELVIKSNPSSITDYENGDIHEMYAFDHSATSQTPALTDYRYIGNAPYNYVYFNCDEPVENQEYNYATSCEKWRIVGIFDVDDGTGYIEKRMKLVRGSALPTNMYFNNIQNSHWELSSLNDFLNDDYFNRTGNALTNGYGLKSSAREMISDAKYYLGSSDSSLITTEQFYSIERGNVLISGDGSDFSKLSWNGKVGLMYPSDEYMVYGKGINLLCYNSPSECIDDNPKSGWIFNSNVLENTNNSSYIWTISPCTYGVSVIDIGSNGRFYGDYVYTMSLGVRPVVYLNSDVLIESGTGRENDPYVLSY